MQNEMPPRSHELLSASTSTLLVIDVQEKLMPSIEGSFPLTRRMVTLIKGAQLLDVPVVATEQYPKGLGQTVTAIRELLPDSPPSKLRFSSAEASGLPPVSEHPEQRHQVVLTGIETHICVLQTALDLSASGYHVYLAADAVGSRNSTDHDIAIQRMRDSGIIVATVESILFEWCESAEHDRFKELSKLVTGR
ncbi:hydrolase [Calycomorphotria hydatis]|uniref:Putative hydrolase n=1 Tax=Calycomorphotria hydatis TaxID=2528027 RepID=A0A517T7Y4_9PLAN|nr:hydrolase [Calycomorphotria hydatis]QDT64485.1 putative hydrolase [Calycomorphotria hydatis]